MIEIKTEKDALNLRWFQKAIKKATHWGKVALGGIFVREDGTTVSSDGYKLHQGPTPPALKQFAGKIIRFNKGHTIYKSPNREYPTHEVDATFPNTGQVFPNGLPDVAIALDKEYLTDALEMPNGDSKVILEFFNTEEDGLLVISNEETEHRAVIMYMESKKVSSWKKSITKAQKMVDYLAEHHPNVYGMLVNAT